MKPKTTEKDTRTIIIETYNDKWPKMFEAEAALIKRALGDNCIMIHHIGSTSVPGLSAKPIIDMIAVVKKIEDVGQAKQAMEALDYLDRGELGIAFRRYFQKGGDARTHHVHTFQEGDPQIERHLKFRDWMRSHPEKAKEYEALKRELADKFPNSIEDYCRGKAKFINIEAETGFEGWQMMQALMDYEWSAVHDLRQQFSANSGKIIYEKDHIHFVYFHNTIIIGYAHLQLMPEHHAELKMFIIDKDHRNDGYGSEFLKLCERWLRLQGYQTLSVQFPELVHKFFNENGYHKMNSNKESMFIKSLTPL